MMFYLPVVYPRTKHDTKAVAPPHPRGPSAGGPPRRQAGQRVGKGQRVLLLQGHGYLDLCVSLSLSLYLRIYMYIYIMYDICM